MEETYPISSLKQSFVSHNGNALCFSSSRLLSSSSSVLVAGGGLAVKRHGLASKPVRTVNLSVKSRQTDYFEKQRFGDSSSSSQNGEGGPARFYVGHSISKGKAALTVEPRTPEFVSLDVPSPSRQCNGQISFSTTECKAEVSRIEVTGTCKCGVISPRSDVGVKEIECWTARLLPSETGAVFLYIFLWLPCHVITLCQFNYKN
ncbi:hypothetical protein HID58_075250 [Brassica napus]|uniref:Uncharacterized protein n=1 Tax=Brassica napus TaxID=3708 RepID=A0ABQ7YLS7_BRANA|nr:hypothetical protein HID58_075250 [Brassica napus]